MTARRDPPEAFDREFSALRALSARIGKDPLLIQAAGGNTSIKNGETLWVKASGLWLARAEDDEIMVPVALAPLLEAVRRGDPLADAPQGFVQEALSPGNLRPSIETTVHAVIPQRVVVHVHCVETIAIAARRDARPILEERLRGLAWRLVPYVRPGLPLAEAITAVLAPGVDILVLANHGLVVAAETVEEAGRLLGRVTGILAAPARPAGEPDTHALLRLAAGSAYRLPSDPRAHQAGRDLESCRAAAGGSLYPDHVIFLGPGSVIAGPQETALDIEARSAGGAAPASILFPGKGVLMRRDATPGAEALAACLSDVLARIPADAPLRYLTDKEHGELLNWDAEKYRQALNRRAGTA